MEQRTDQGAEPQAAGTQAVTRRVKVWSGLVSGLLVLWFFFAWLILDRHVLDAAGESVGTAFALGIVVSLFGALRGSR